MMIENHERHQNSVKESNKEELITLLLTEDNRQDVDLRFEELLIQYS